MKPKLVSISEEIVRWGFEITIRESNDWFTAFANPTAGPWKRITVPNSINEKNEVYRFKIDETRPDLILVNDHKKVILIIEAKTSFADLARISQLKKTCELFRQLSNKLQSLGTNEFWGARSGYKYQLGLLWAAGPEGSQRVSAISKEYLTNVSDLVDDIYCIEGTYVDNKLTHKAFWGRSRRIIEFK
jgi:hypothetical protein